MIEANWQCASCGKPIYRKNAHGHHRIPRRKAPELAFVKANIKPLCQRCHAIEERGPHGCSVDGQPLDPMHPWNRGGEG